MLKEPKEEEAYTDSYRKNYRGRKILPLRVKGRGNHGSRGGGILSEFIKSAGKGRPAEREKKGGPHHVQVGLVKKGELGKRPRYCFGPEKEPCKEGVRGRKKWERDKGEKNSSRERDSEKNFKKEKLSGGPLGGKGG